MRRSGRRRHGNGAAAPRAAAQDDDEDDDGAPAVEDGFGIDDLAQQDMRAHFPMSFGAPSIFVRLYFLLSI